MSDKQFLLSLIESQCEIILSNAKHPSRRADTERAIQQLNQYTGDYLKADPPAPPTLGISVTDGIRADDKVG